MKILTLLAPDFYIQQFYQIFKKLSLNDFKYCTIHALEKNVF